uniref:Uncharacterized protein n=2 Tax=Lotus japonicus TaxID=34305 RepID=I3SPS0_LOTJA|nr:unknown [Lotus japonicus]
MENNGNGDVNKGNRKAYRDEKDELKDGLAQRDADEEILTREEKNNPRKDKPFTELLKLGNDESKEDGNNTTLETTNLQRVMNNGINAHPEEHEDNLVQQNWSRRHINKASNNTEQTKSNMLHEETEELEVSREQKQEKDVSDDGGDDDEGNDNDLVQESQSEFEDVKEEYREEIDESEFQPDL